MLYCQECGEAVKEGIPECPACGAEMLFEKQKNKDKISIGLMVGIVFVVFGFVSLIVVVVVAVFLFPSSEIDSDANPESTPSAKESTRPVVQKKDFNKIDESAPEILKQFHDTASEIAVSAIGGRDDLIDGELQVSPVPSGATDVDLTSNYHYKPLSTPPLFTDIMQLGGYEFEKELGKGTKISIKEENAVGELVERQLAEGEFQGKLNLHSKDVAYIRALGGFLASKVKRKGIKYKFFIVDTDKFNALAFPGGRIYIFQGLLDKLDNEAQLAAVVAHEIKHVDLRHTITLYQIVSRMPSGQGFAAFILSQAKHPFQGRVEADADRRGLELAYACGYSPFQPVEFWRQVAADCHSSSPKKGNGLIGLIVDQVANEARNVLDTHPADTKRYILLQNHVLKLLKKYPRPSHYVGRWNFRNKITMHDEIK